jgi:hypothetical protein
MSKLRGMEGEVNNTFIAIKRMHSKRWTVGFGECFVLQLPAKTLPKPPTPHLIIFASLQFYQLSRAFPARSFNNISKLGL